MRAAPLVRVKVKFTVKNAVREESSATAYGVFDCDFCFDSRVDLRSALNELGINWGLHLTGEINERGSGSVSSVRSYVGEAWS